MIRSGQDYIKGLQAQAKKNVWIAGRKIDDVVADPHFKRPVATLAELYDLQCSPQHGVKMSAGGTGSEAYGLSFLIPSRTEDIVDRRNAMAVWANATFGMVGRSPDYCNTVLMSFQETGFFQQAGADFDKNLSNYYEYCRTNDLFLTHAIVNPQTDRSKTFGRAGKPARSPWHCQQKQRGLIVRGAKMLATHGPTADELIVYPLPGSVMPGEEKNTHSLSAFPTDTPGLKFICREPFDDGHLMSPWDHPLGEPLRRARRHGGVR